MEPTEKEIPKFIINPEYVRSKRSFHTGEPVRIEVDAEKFNYAMRACKNQYLDFYFEESMKHETLDSFEDYIKNHLWEKTKQEFAMNGYSIIQMENKLTQVDGDLLSEVEIIAFKHKI